MRRGIVAAAFLIAAVAAPPAEAADGDYCVAVTRAGCERVETLAEALAAPDRVRVMLPSGTFAAGAGDDDRTVEIRGSGDTTLTGALELTSPASALRDLTLEGHLDLAGHAEDVRLEGGARLLAGARLVQATLTGGVLATGDAQLDDVVLDTLVVECADVLGRHLTIEARAGTACPQPGAAALELRSSVVGAADPFDGPVTTAYSEHAEDPDATATGRREPGAPRVDAGDPEPLAPFEPFEDVDGDTRVVDGDGDGRVRRDVGAQELQPPPVPRPGGNVLTNPGAEQGLSGWSGTFTTATYGDDPLLPGTRAAAALGAGSAFFTAAGVESAQLLQRIDLTASAAAVDTGDATAALSGLLGGYGDDPDEVTLTAAFRDPEGATLGELAIGPVTPAERGKATNLLHRAASGTIPARTRGIDVTLAGRRAAGAYTDAYADELALVLSVNGVPVEPPVEPGDPVVPGLRPFAGVSVLTGRPAFNRRWRARVAVACPDATVIRCKGVLELRARLPRTREQVRIAHFLHVSLAPGQVRTYTLRMLLAARRALKMRRNVRARLVAVSTDGQAVQRQRTVALRLRLPGAGR